VNKVFEIEVLLEEEELEKLEKEIDYKIPLKKVNRRRQKERKYNKSWVD
jgi:hypothetical protein